jgi:hypothetical protein
VGQDVPTAEYYDFLYRDSSRIASYYAQLFGSHLTSVEESDSNKLSSEKGLTGSLHVVGGAAKTGKETQSGTKRVSSPHDVATTDVLSALTAGDRIKNFATAPHGALFEARGTLVLIDGSFLELASIAFEMWVREEKKKRRHERNEDLIRNQEAFQNLLTKLRLPSAFVLVTSDGQQLAGTVKESGMEEPIVSYHFKHGTSGLADVYLVGIKEIPSGTPALMSSAMIAVAQEAAEKFANLLFPKEATRVTPIALFRKF